MDLLAFNLILYLAFTILIIILAFKSNKWFFTNVNFIEDKINRIICKSFYILAILFPSIFLLAASAFMAAFSLAYLQYLIDPMLFWVFSDFRLGTGYTFFEFNLTMVILFCCLSIFIVFIKIWVWLLILKIIFNSEHNIIRWVIGIMIGLIFISSLSFISVLYLFVVLNIYLSQGYQDSLKKTP